MFLWSTDTFQKSFFSYFFFLGGGGQFASRPLGPKCLQMFSAFHFFFFFGGGGGDSLHPEHWVQNV